MPLEKQKSALSGIQQQIEDRLWRESAAVFGLRPRPKAGDAKLTAALHFIFPAVLCY